MTRADLKAWRWGVRGSVSGAFAVALGGYETYASASRYPAAILLGAAVGFAAGVFLAEVRQIPPRSPRIAQEPLGFSILPSPSRKPYDWAERTAES